MQYSPPLQVCVPTCRKAIPTGMIAGAGGQFLASPTDLVKVRLQVEGKRVLEGHPPRSVHTLKSAQERMRGVCYPSYTSQEMGSTTSLCVVDLECMCTCFASCWQLWMHAQMCSHVDTFLSE